MNGQIQYGRARGVMSSATPAASRQPRHADPRRFGAAPKASRPLTMVLVGSILLVALLAAIPVAIPGLATIAILGATWLALVLALTLPSAQQRAGSELAHRLGEFRHAVNAIGDNPTRPDLERVLDLRRDLGLQDEEVSDELAQIHAALDALALREQLQGGTMPTVTGVEALPAGDQCHFMCPVRYGRRRSDQFGHLMLTSAWLKFRGPLDVSVMWSDVHAVQRAGREVIVDLKDDSRTLRFSCPTVEDAARASVLADHLVRAAAQAVYQVAL